MNQQRIRWITGGIALLSLILLWLSFINLPQPTQVNLDTSWVQILGDNFSQNRQAGVDYIFTYGPLGYFFVKNASYNAELFYVSIFWWCIFSGLLALIFLARWYQLPNWPEKMLFSFLAIVVITDMAIVSDPLYFLAMVAMTTLLIHPPVFFKSAIRYWTMLGGGGLILAVLCLTKFTLFMVAILCVVGISIVVWQRYSFQAAVINLLSFVMMLMGVWIISGQSLENLPTFLWLSSQITSYYSEAMSVEADLSVLGFALASMAAIAVMVIISCLTKPIELARFVSGGVILLVLFLSWKSGFTRYVAVGTTTFFVFAMTIPFFIQRPPTIRTSRLFSGLLFVSILIPLLGAFYTVTPLGYSPINFMARWHQRIVNNTTTLLLPEKTKVYYDNVTEVLKQKYQLPKIKAAIQNGTVDMFNPLQGIVFFNEFNYISRPVFQGYSAYSPELLEINRRFYANSKTAPQFILFRLTALDERFPTLEDSQALNVILRDYQPLFMERGFLLLKHQPRPTEIVASQPLLTQKIQLGEEIHLQAFSDKSLFLSLEIGKSLLGQISSPLYKLPPLFIEVQTTDGTVFTHRLIVSISQADFLINPLILEHNDLLKWYLGEPLKQVARLRIVVKSDWARHLFQPNITVKLKENQVAPYPIDENVKHELRKFLSN